MSNKKYYKRIKKNQSMNLNNSGCISLDNGYITFDKSCIIPFPRFLMNEAETSLLLHLAGHVAGYMEGNNIESVEQWDEFADTERANIEINNFILNAYGKICCKYLNIDMIEYAPILLENVGELFKFNRSWFDGFITPKTNFKYEWLPILNIITYNINNHVINFAPKYIKALNEYNKQTA